MSSGQQLPGFLPRDPRVEEPYRLTSQTALRIAILGAIAIALFAALFLRLWALQVISGERYLLEAQNNQVRSARVEASRGTIVDRNGNLLVSNQAATSVQLWPATIRDLPPAEAAAMFRKLAPLLGLKVGEIQKAMREHRDDPLTPVTIKTAVRNAKVLYLLEHQAEFPGVELAQTELRRYDEGGLAAQILGYVSEISPEQLKQLEKKGYAAGDRIGQTGIESAYDLNLRGTPGISEVRVDALGQVTSDRQFSRAPEAGYSVKLTLDAGLQRAAESALAYGVRLAHNDGEWAANGGAIVAMDPDTGEVLALASNPTFDPSLYVGRVETKDLKRLAAPAANYPTLNRAVSGLYPPGSTFKPVTALAGIQEGLLNPSSPIQCTGQIEVGRDKQIFKNWDPTKNEPMTLTTALANSCDTYFYEVALRAYERPDSPIQKWARTMGFGVSTGIDVGPESDGLVPTPAWRKRHFKDPREQVWTNGDSVQLGIGQGDLLVTPLQMTRLYAMLANGGKLVEPRVVKAIEQNNTEGAAPLVVRPFIAPKPVDLGIDPAAIQVVQDGLYDATHASYGTSTNVFADFPYPISGKTGTAEKFVQLPGFQGLRDQSWWCGWGPSEKAELVVCALIENGGHGGTAAAPAALKVFEHYFQVPAGSYETGVVESD